jgi:hypothetical protein
MNFPPKCAPPALFYASYPQQARALGVSVGFCNLRIGAVQRKTPFKAFRGLLGMAAFEVCAAT